MANAIFSRKNRFLLFLCVVFHLLFMHTRAFYFNKTDNVKVLAPVGLVVQANQVVMSNEFVTITITKPGGLITSIQYNNIDNLLANSDPGKHNCGYWDCGWGSDGGSSPDDKLDKGTQFEVIANTLDQVEISFMRRWDNKSALAMNVDKLEDP